MMSVVISMAYRSSWKFWQASAPATIRHPLKPRHPVSRIVPQLNRSLRVESRSDRLTGDPSAVLLREILEANGIVT